MAAAAQTVGRPVDFELAPIAEFPGIRALAWSGKSLFASRGYTLLRADVGKAIPEWKTVATFRASWWRKISSSSRLAARMFRDGFHALCVLPSGDMIAAVPGAIVNCAPGEREFRVSHGITRGTRPLHIASGPEGRLFFGEYFDNPTREEVHIYGSTDRGKTWDVVYSFRAGAIRHVHNIVFDRWEGCFWVLTGDVGAECRILRASCDFKTWDVVLAGNQQARAAALVATQEAVYFASDTPFETNHVYRLDRKGSMQEVATLNGSSTYAGRVGAAIFFSTMVEPSAVNREGKIRVYGSCDGFRWRSVLEWKKDGWPLRLFQYGNAMLPDGEGSPGVLAVSTLAVSGADSMTGFWRVQCAGGGL